MGRSEAIVVVPAYNEAKHLSQTLGGLQAMLSPQEEPHLHRRTPCHRPAHRFGSRRRLRYRSRFLRLLRLRAGPKLRPLSVDIIVVNDGSSDQTGVLARQAGCSCVSLPFHSGYGTAVQAGYKYALSKGYQYVILVDGDGQHDVRFLPKILRALRERSADVVVGSRFLAHDGSSPPPERPMYFATRLRRVGIRLFRLLLRLWGLSVTDPTSGFIGLERSAFKFLAGDVFPFDYPDADVLLLLHRNGFKVREVPVYMYPNPERGSIHRGCAPFWYMIKEFLSVAFAGVRRKEIS